METGETAGAGMGPLPMVMNSMSKRNAKGSQQVSERFGSSEHR